ncbi:maintenance of mitochondrial structure and function-domain-containing protein [Dichotomocladium elegans]|nr:maintenance of mitochondrial structure and function-domain-containing protein [Dichotomocladium elegans]
MCIQTQLATQAQVTCAGHAETFTALFFLKLRLLSIKQQTENEMSAMEISEDEQQQQQLGPSTIVSATPSSSGLSISIHPLVLLNISDHYTRAKLQDPENASKGEVYGALLAQQSGRDIDVINSYEIPVPHEGQVNLAYLSSKTEQLKQVFPNLDFMGWYTIGTSPTEADLKLQEQFLQVNESAIFLQLDPSSGTRDFPVHIYESTLDIIDQQARLVFVKAPYHVETNEAERVAVDHVAKPSSSGGEASLSSALVSHLTTQRNAIAMLHSRVRFLCQYLQDIVDGKVPRDHDLLRQTASVVRRSPLMDNNEFNEQFATEMNDVMLVAYLTTITKGINAMNDLVDKFNLAHGSIHAISNSMPGSSGGGGERGLLNQKSGMMSPASGRRRTRMFSAHIQ